MIYSLIILAVIAWLFYYLLIKGKIWPVLLFVFGTYGGHSLILHIIPASKHTILTFMLHDVSYASFFAAIISLLGVAVLIGEY